MNKILFFPTLLPAMVTASLALAAGAGTARAALPPELLAQLPLAAEGKVDFVRDIQPIFEASCVQCHARGKAKGSFSIETRADFLFGGDSGEVAIAGKSGESLVIEMISGLDPEVVMPKKGKKLTRAEVSKFRAWIDQGMPWPEEITFFKSIPANLTWPEIEDPAPKKGFENPLDRLVDDYFAKNNVPWKQPVGDRVYARRVWLDTVGLLPPPEELEAFVADRAPDKRAKLVRRLLADDQRYAEHWLTFWNDKLRNDYKGTGYIDGGRKQITRWLYTALARNLPYDQFVAELINPGSEAEGFTKGILWRGAVNASMVPPMQAAQGIAQVFLGVNLKCASCHDSFINEYTLYDSYGLAAVYSDGPLEIAECDKPTGEMAPVKFLYGDLGEIDPEGDAAARKRQLAEIITGRKNGRLPRTIVNRLWQRFMGYGLVEPVDEMDKPAWSPEVVDWLAEDLASHGYDLKHTIERILTSRAYQLPSVSLGEAEEDYVFQGPAVRRLSAEQFSDAIRMLVRTDYGEADAKLNRLAAIEDDGAAALPLQPKWIWTTPDAHIKAQPETVVFKREVTLPVQPTAAFLTIAADDNHRVTINGTTIVRPAKRNSTSTSFHELLPHLRVGKNTIEVTAANLPPDDRKTVPEELKPEYESPAGLLLYARIRAGGTVMDFVSDDSWTATRPDSKEEGRAVELGGVELAPWRLGRVFLDVAAAEEDTLPVKRAALVAADPLMAALGRPNREQVVTVRQSTATTLQALELTNGSTLATLLKEGAGRILKTDTSSCDSLVEALYEQTLSRKPTARERELAMTLVGSPARPEGIEDLLWVLAMLPEFQLIY